MSHRVASVLALAAVVVLTAGCPSKEGEQKDAQTSSSGAASSGGPVAPVAAGPLANLESSPFAMEVWRDEGGQPLQLLFYTRENVRVSGACRAPDGAIRCDALRFLRAGAPVQIPRREIDGRTSAGVKACRKLGFSMVVLHGPSGAEDGMCRFPDGSLVANGALEQYGLRITE